MTPAQSALSLPASSFSYPPKFRNRAVSIWFKEDEKKFKFVCPLQGSMMPGIMEGSIVPGMQRG